VDVDGLRIGYRRQGQGDPLLLLHGGFSDSREWRAQLDGRCDEYDVIAVDSPGCGGSSDPPDGFTLRDYAEVLAGFLDVLEVEHPHVGGLSFGSTYALLLYRHHATIPRSLILAGAYAGWVGSLPATEVARRVQWIKDVLDRPVAEWGRDFLATAYGKSTPPAVLAEAMEILRDVRRDGFRRIAEAFLYADLREVLPLVTVPTLLLYGERDERSPMPVALDLQARIRGSRLAVLSGAGHSVNTEVPVQFNTAVRAFLSSL